MLIVLSGKAGSGKDTVAKLLVDIFLEKYDIRFDMIAYGDALKHKLMSDFGLTYDQVYKDKEVPDKRYPFREAYELDYIKDKYWTPRELMQFIGTDVYRRIDPNYWVNILRNKVNNSDSNFIITDGRFINEIDWVIEKGGVHVLIERNQLTGKYYKHPSEKEFTYFDASNSIIIENNFFTVDELKHLLYTYVSEEIINKLKGDCYGS